MSEKTEFTDERVRGKITDEDVAQVRAMIGLKLPSEQYRRDSTVETITGFSQGIGDLNPLYRDVEYAHESRYGIIIGHPCFPYVLHWPGGTRWGLPGAHGFYAGNDWEFFRSALPGDRINCYERVAGIEEKESKFSGRLVIQYVDTTFANQRGEVLARVLGWCTRHERRAARDRGKYGDVPRQHEYTREETARIERAALEERNLIRGRETRYWEDVQVGEELPSIVRGPLSWMDTARFLAACGRGDPPGVQVSQAAEHPDHVFRNPEAGGAIERAVIDYHRDSVAEKAGVPGAYDYGPQRTSWLASLVTHWMGDDAYLKRLRTEMRRFNVRGDTTWCKGRVKEKRWKDGYALVDIEIWAENQRGEVTTPGLATVMLPSRSIESKVVIDGSQLDLALPIPR